MKIRAVDTDIKTRIFYRTRQRTPSEVVYYWGGGVSKRLKKRWKIRGSACRGFLV